MIRGRCFGAVSARICRRRSFVLLSNSCAIKRNALPVENISCCRFASHSSKSQTITDTTAAFNRFKQKLQVQPPGRASLNSPWSKFPPRRLEEETQQLIQELQSSDENEGSVEPSDYLGIFQAWTRLAPRKGISAAQQAESLLQSLEQQFANRTTGPVGSMYPCYVEVLQAYATCEGGLAAAKSAQRLLDSLLINYSDQVTTEVFNHCLDAWVNIDGKAAAEEARKMREAMHNIGCLPNSATIQTTMQIWTKSGHPKAPEKIMDLLIQTIKNWQANKRSNDGVVAPTIGMFHSAMGALSKSATQLNQRKLREVAEQLEALLQLMLDRRKQWQIRPNLRTYLIVLGAWERVEKVEKTGRAAQKAENILMYMIREADKYNSSSDIDRKNGNQSLLQVCEPNSICFTSAMAAWNHAEQPQRAEDLYHKLVNRYHTKGDKRLRPAVVDAMPVLSAWANAGRPDRVLQLMQAMQQIARKTSHPDCQIDMTVFNILLHALSRDADAEEALSLLRWLEDPENGSDAQTEKYSHYFPPEVVSNVGLPNEISYASVLAGLARQGLAAEAYELLMRMEQRNIKPNIVAYTNAIHAFASTRYPDKVARAYKLLQEVAQKEKPDVICIVAFIQVCAHAEPSERRLALDLAWQAFNTLEPRVRNERAYKTMASVVNNLMVGHEEASSVNEKFSTPEQIEAERQRLLKDLAIECCKAGFLTQQSRQEFERRSTSKSNTILGWLQSHRFHPKWSRNVPISQKPTELQVIPKKQ